MFLELGWTEFIVLKDNIFSINKKYSNFKCDLKSFIEYIKLGESAKDEYNTLDAIKYLQFCLNLY